MTRRSDHQPVVEGTVPIDSRASVRSAVLALTGADPALKGVVGSHVSAPGYETFTLTPPWRPRLLVPTGYPKHAARAVSEFGHHRSEPSNRAGGALSRTLAHASIPTKALAIADSDGPVQSTPLNGFLAELFGRDKVVLAVRAVLDRPNAKPVVIVMDADAEVLGFCKVGWDDLTRRLVRHERTTLDVVRQAGVADLTIPDTVHGGDWSGLELLVTRPVDIDRRRLSLADQVKLALRLGDEQSTGTKILAESRRVKDLADRIQAVEFSAPARITDVMNEAYASVLGRWGDRVQPMTREHGDFVATNVAPSHDGRTTVVWDWERSTDDSPIGVDAAHAVVAQLVRAGDRYDRLAPTLSDALVSAGGPADFAPALALIDLIDMVLRHEEARLANLRCEDPGYAASLGAMLRFFPA